jgi:hypothetical protein
MIVTVCGRCSLENRSAGANLAARVLVGPERLALGRHDREPIRSIRMPALAAARRGYSVAMPQARGWLWLGACAIAGVSPAFVVSALGVFTVPVGILIVLDLAWRRAGAEMEGILVGVGGLVVGAVLWGTGASAVTAVAPDFESPRVVGRLGEGPFSSVQLQVAPSGRGAVIWQQPAGGPEALELVVLGRGGVLRHPGEDRDRCAARSGQGRQRD